MVTFSGALLLDSSDESEYSSGAITPPEIFDDDVSQVVTIEQTSESGENTPMMETFQDVFKAFLHRVPRNSRYHKHKRSNTLASSTLDGLDVYSRDPVFSTNPLLSVKHQYFSQRFGKLDEELPLNARNESPDISSELDHVSDEGFFEESSIFKGRTELVRLSSYYEVLVHNDISLLIIEITLVRFDHFYVNLCRGPAYFRDSSRESESHSAPTVDRGYGSASFQSNNSPKYSTSTPEKTSAYWIFVSISRQQQFRADKSSFS